MVSLAFSTPIKKFNQKPVGFWISFEPTLFIGINSIRNRPTTPHALLRPIALSFIGALASLIAFPLSEYPLNTALKLAELWCLLFGFPAIDNIDAKRCHLCLELPTFSIVPMAAIN